MTPITTTRVRPDQTALPLGGSAWLLNNLFTHIYALRNDTIEACARIADEVEAQAEPGHGKDTAARIGDGIRALLQARVASGTTLRKCKQCGEWLRIGAGGYRKHRAFCSNKCRARHHRAHKALLEVERLKAANAEPPTYTFQGFTYAAPMDQADGGPR